MQTRNAGRLMGVAWAFQLTIAAIATAQVTTGQVVGSVVDPNGQPVRQVELRLTDPLHGVVRTSTTDAEGAFRVADPGKGAICHTEK